MGVRSVYCKCNRWSECNYEETLASPNDEGQESTTCFFLIIFDLGQTLDAEVEAQ
ncbi:hypothetical protein JTE90_017750 [Oedothorax gibbosus]|uniref:Uncharacterized protein n=1 Tax=Oedothorax gibbosus TaxID=931172 RepID=A0AAV6UMX0_9ARAC|nr:hypothetical protein JTE90_017750 [Oedothorax gibbosus]